MVACRYVLGMVGACAQQWDCVMGTSADDATRAHAFIPLQRAQVGQDRPTQRPTVAHSVILSNLRFFVNYKRKFENMGRGLFFSFL